MITARNKSSYALPARQTVVNINALGKRVIAVAFYSMRKSFGC